MGKISERINHLKMTHGYCFICGKYGRFSKDHVPPQCATILTPMLQKTICEVMDGATDVKPVGAKNGTVFRTICGNCNSSVLGKYDWAIGEVTKMFKTKIVEYVNGRMVSNFIKIPYHSLEYCRAMIGHVLSATSQQNCKEPLEDSVFFTPLRDFVLGYTDDICNTHDIYYWFYPRKMNITAQSIGFHNEGHTCVLCALHFFPIAFIVTLRGEGISPRHATKLDPKVPYMTFNMTSVNIDNVAFPFVPLKGNQMCILNSGLTCVSYPATNRAAYE